MVFQVTLVAEDVVFDASAPSPDPQSQGWTGQDVSPPGTDVFGNDGLIDYPNNVGQVPGGLWQVADQVPAPDRNLPGYSRALDAALLQKAFERGWSFEASVRARLSSTHSGFTGWGFSQANDPGWGTFVATTRVGFHFGVGDDDEFYVTLGNEAPVHLEAGSAGQVHTIRAEGMPRSPLYEWYLDGVYQGQADIREGVVAGGLTLDQVYFGARSSNALGEVSNWALVRWCSGPEIPAESLALVPEIRAHSDSMVGNGIDAATGSFQRGLELLSVLGVREVPFPIYYDSRLTARRGPLGYGWSHPYEVRLVGQVEGRGDIVIQWDAHRSSRFVYDEFEEAYRGADEDVRYATLEHGTFPQGVPSPWVLRLLDGTLFNFQDNGQLSQIQNAAGQSMEVLYESGGGHEGRFASVSDNYSDKSLDVSYNDEGLLATVCDPMGREVQLTYDGQRRLVAATAPMLFDEPGHLYDAPGGRAEIPDNDPNGVLIEWDVADEGLVGQVRLEEMLGFHARTADLQASLTSPSGTTVNVALEPTFLGSEESGFAASFDPEAFSGLSRKGIWVLKLVDLQPGFDGWLESAVLQFTHAPRTISFTYDSQCRIVAGHDMLGEQLFTCTYDALGRVIRQDDGRGDTPPIELAYLEKANGDLETQLTDPMGNVFTYLHDEAFHLLSVENPLGHAVTFEYDGNGNRVSRTDARGNTTRFAYDGLGNMASVTAPGNHTTVFTGAISSITDALGHTSTFAYDSSGRMISVTDAANHTDTKEYHSSGQLKKVTLHDQADIEFEQDQYGQPVSSRRAQSADRSRAEYDMAGRLIKSWDAKDRLTEIKLNAAGDVLQELDPLGHVVTSVYDHRGRLVKKIDRRGHATTFAFDGNNNVLSTTNALGQVTQYEYDLLDRAVRITDPSGASIQFSYDGVGRRIATTDALGRTTRREYDANGNLVATYRANGIRALQVTYDERDLPVRFEDAQGHVSLATYDAVGRKTSVTDPRGRVTTFVYDRLDRLARVVDPLGREASMTYASDDVVQLMQGPGALPLNFYYDKGNNLTTVSRGVTIDENERNVARYQYDVTDRLAIIDFNNARMRFTYDALGRMTLNLVSGSRTTTDDFNRAYDYDPSGNLTAVRARAINVARGDFTDRHLREYDALGRMTSFTDELGNRLEYSYDLAGNLKTLVYPGGWTVTYGYDVVRRLTSVTDGDGRVTRYTWNDEDQLTGVSFPNGTKRVMAYDQAGRLIFRQDLQANGGNIARFHYHYDANGELENEETDPPAPLVVDDHTLTYDDRYRLVSVDGQPVGHDLDGNLVTGPPGHGLDRLDYNSRGHLVGTDGYVYDYDEEDRLVGWHPKGNDPAAVRFLVNPGASLSQILSQSAPGGVLTRYVYGIGLIYQETGGDIEVFHYDQRGSTIALSDGSGTISGRVQYSPYGKIVSRTGHTNTLFLFNGLFGVVTSPDDLAHMRFRWYWPEVGRFLSEDTHLGHVSQPTSMNVFAFGHGNPVTRVDPEGEFPWIAIGALAGGLINTAVTLTVDYIDDGQINRDPAEYVASFVGGAVAGGLGAATFGASGAFAIAAVVGTGAASAAAESVTYGLLSGEGVDGGDVAVDAAVGGAVGLFTFGAGKAFSRTIGKAFGKFTGAVFRKFGNKPYVGRVVRFFFTPTKVSNRRAIGSFEELIAREAKRRAASMAKDAFLSYVGGVAVGVTEKSRKRAANAILEYLGLGQRPQADTGLGIGAIHLGSTGEINRGRVHAYGEYIHYNIYLEALSLAGRPVPNNPSNTLSGF